MFTVAEWLTSLGMAEYGDRFAENDIDITVLSELSDQHLKDLGVSLGHRLKMLRAIRELTGAASTKPQPAATAAAASSQDGAERRQLTVMFCDLVGSTELSSRLDPEDMREVILAYQTACSGVMPTYDGFVAKFMGDGVLAYFGYPRAHEDDAERAVRAGLDIIAAVRRIRTRSGAKLEVRIGIATGLVVVGDLIGEGASQEKAVVGDTPNLAARLQGLAGPGTIVVGASTRRLLGDLFRLRDLGHHELRGLAGPVNAWAVEGLSPAESRFEAVHAGRLTSFVGREAEIGLLLDRKNMAWRGEGQIVLVSGEPGIGKSRVATALSERIHEQHTRLRYQCSAYYRDSALYPFIAQLEQAAQLKPDDPPERRLDQLEAVLVMGTSRVQAVAPLFAAMLSIPFTGRYPPLALTSAQQRRQTLAALLDQFEGLARQQPILLLFEDVQWADPTSIELLDLRVERIRHLPVLAIFTFRPEFEPPWTGLPNVSALALGRLDQSRVQTMVSQLAGGRRLPAEVMNQIVAKTDGIPLFVEELTKAVMESGILVEDGESYRLDGPLPPLAIPATLHDSLMARLDRLAPVKEIAQVGAAIGREFSYGVLQAVTGHDVVSLNSALSQLEEAELLFRTSVPPDVRYSFKHALVQEAAYESLLKSRRQILHRRIAETLRDRFPTLAESEPEIVGHHFTQAGLAEAAAGWWGKAGDRAMNKSAHHEAIAHLEKALGLASALIDEPARRLLRLRLQTTYGYALFHTRGQTAPETIAAFARARALSADVEQPAEKISACWGMWAASFVHADLTTMLEVTEDLMREAQRLPGSLEAVLAHRMSGITFWFQGDYASAREHLEQAFATHDHERDRHLASRFGYYSGPTTALWLAQVLWPLGHVARATHMAEQGLRLALETGHIPTLAQTHYLACVLAAVGRKPDRVMWHAEALISLAREHALPLWLAHGTFLVGWARCRAGDRTGEAGMRNGLAMLHDMDVRLRQPLYGTLLAEHEAEAGDVEAALVTLGAQLAMIKQTGERWFHAKVHQVGGKLLTRQPSKALDAEVALNRAIEIARSQQTRTFELCAALSLAKLYQTTGRSEAARELLAPAVVGFSEGPELPEVAESNRLLASLEQRFGAA